MTQKSFSLAIKIFIGSVMVGLFGLSVYFYIFLFQFDSQPIMTNQIPVENIDLNSYQQLTK